VDAGAEDPDALIIDGVALPGRLFLGTAGYPSPKVLQDAIAAARPGLVTVSLRRETAGGTGAKFWALIRESGAAVLPNTAGCYTAREAVETARMAREVFGTHWIKLETIGDDYTLAPDPIALVEAAGELIADGFHVFPYMTEDLAVARRLADAGCRVLMPWGAPIGTGRGLANPAGLAALRARHPEAVVVVDAGLGAPSQAARALEMGCDAVLVNTAVAKARDPVAMARAFAQAIAAGRAAFRAGPIAPQDSARPSTPVVGRPFWQEGA
jgi:thiazole synthase